MLGHELPLGMWALGPSVFCKNVSMGMWSELDSLIDRPPPHPEAA